jgi:hypothetical protein
MQFQSHENCIAWCERNGMQVRRRSPAPTYRSGRRFEIPADAGRRVALARLLWSAIASDASESLLWVTTHSIWPSGEHLPLVEAARASWGAQHPFSEQPGISAGAHEGEHALSFVVLAILFLWDLWVLPAGRRRALELSHDEFGVAYFESESESESFASSLQEFRIQSCPLVGQS